MFLKCYGLSNLIDMKNLVFLLIYFIYIYIYLHLHIYIYIYIYIYIHNCSYVFGRLRPNQPRAKTALCNGISWPILESGDEAKTTVEKRRR